ncbi:L-fucose:H+ symporter permease [Mucilaginibacter myungsuensis]|uniref:L-fucose:H+ symporter permease n=1 Tax=Mucilaginibacter myungsuensis TaxID=649104 RepID=A0A929L5Q4_9SPHI|nr:L-fucose:H+ symporter permease [Mucilaginibacter myungsuensis]MBE9663691.1 L-fucose:H+ symporter permease [Mucilaginibacter myungsuensis]MDN3598985.1 L-fucose:H+ symporter permease [Mucilaginibacter myungsuensis]
MSAEPKFTEKRYTLVLCFVTSLFLLWGVAITMGDVLNKHFQNVLHISKAASGYVQFSIFGAYAVMGIPAGLFMKYFGYKRGVQLGLLLYAIGAFLFIPAANAGSFGQFRLALFVLACGLATLEAVAHPFMAALGPQETSDQRINFAQAFNGLGGVIGPLIGGYFILRAEHAHTADLVSVKYLYITIGLVITVIAIAFSFVKVPELHNPHTVATDTYAVGAEPIADKKLFSHKHFIFAIVAQFFNVAAQGGTWAFFINYGREIMGLTDERASYYFSLSIAMMMVGRFAGTFLMRYIAPSKLLSAFAIGNVVMCVIVAQGAGVVSFVALLMVNFFFSIMFPTIFSLGLKNLGRHTEQGASFIVMGVVGGAVFPPLMGIVADKHVATAYFLPIICYLVIFVFGYYVTRAKIGALKPK